MPYNYDRTGFDPPLYSNWITLRHLPVVSWVGMRKDFCVRSPLLNTEV